MLYIVRLVLSIFVLLVFRSTWVPAIAIQGVTPDLFLGVVFVVTVQRGVNWGVWTSFALGILLDLEQPSRLGLEALAFSLAAVIVDRSSRSLDKRNPIVLLALFLLTALVTESVRMLWVAEGHLWRAIGLYFRYGILGALYTTAFVAPVSWLASRLLGWKAWVLRAS